MRGSWSPLAARPRDWSSIQTTAALAMAPRSISDRTRNLDLQDGNSSGVMATQTMRTGTRLWVLPLLLAWRSALGVGEGDTAPDFMLPVLGDDTIVSLSESQGTVRYVDFWASWCIPCRIAVPQLVALQEELGGDAFQVIGINTDERVEDALDYAERYAMNYVNLSDPDGDAARAYDLQAMPMSYVIDREGRVTLAHAGFRRGDMEAIRAHILELLGLDPSAEP